MLTGSLRGIRGTYVLRISIYVHTYILVWTASLEGFSGGAEPM